MSKERVEAILSAYELPWPEGYTLDGNCVGNNSGGGSFVPTEKNGPWYRVDIDGVRLYYDVNSMKVISRGKWLR